MLLIYLTEHGTEPYGVKIEKFELVKIQKLKIIYKDEKNILCVKPLETFLGKCDVTKMLIKLGSLDKSVFNGYKTLLEISEEKKTNMCMLAQI